MGNPYKTIGTAKTLADLKVLVEEAILLAGPDAEWNGFDDGTIVIHSLSAQDDSEKWPIPGWYRIRSE